jgi:hypothetical protein
MSQELRFQAAARNIADDIVAQARSDDDSVHWVTVGVANDRTERWRASADLYSGTAGIALFLIEASSQLGENSYLDVALAALDWCEREMSGNGNYSVFGGRMGISLARLRAAAMTGDSAHLEAALRVASGYEPYVASATAGEFLGGLAGAMLGFLHLHQQTEEPSLIGAIHACAKRLILSARWTPEGLCWDVAREHIKGLCGMSHGAAGIAFSLLEADAYLDEPAYRQIALEALRYEKCSYDPDRQLWLDFRKLVPQRAGSYEEEEPPLTEEFLMRPGVMDAWCHGSAGIAISRLRALELLGMEWYEESMRAITRTRTATYSIVGREDFTLCHGACGNATVFLEAWRVLGDRKYRMWAEEIGERAIASHERTGLFYSGYAVFGRPEDLSLMMGNAGIGHFFLQLDGDTPNILAPRIAGKAASQSHRGSDDCVALVLAQRLMPESMSAIEENCPAECELFFAGWRERSEVLAFLALQTAKAGLHETFELESEKGRMRDSCPSFALVTVVRSRENRRSAGLTHDDLGRFRFQLAAFSLVWTSPAESDPLRLLRVADTDVAEIRLSDFSAAVLAAFINPATLDGAIRSLEKLLEANSELTTAALQKAVQSQLMDAIRAGLIVVAEP